MFNSISGIHRYQTGGSLQDNYFRIPIINKHITETSIFTVGQNSGMIYQDQSETLLPLRHSEKISRIALKVAGVDINSTKGRRFNPAAVNWQYISCYLL